MEAVNSKDHRTAVLALALAVLCACGEDVAPGRTASTPVDAGIKSADASARGHTGRLDASVGDAGHHDTSVARDAGAVSARGDLPALCSRPGSDAVRDVFCKDGTQVRSLRDLQGLFGFGQTVPVGTGDGAYEGDAAASDADYTGAGDASYPGSASDDNSTIVDGVIVIAHSTALSGRLVSPINPRAILLGQDSVMTFQRGVQQVELATHARESGGFAFFLVSFTQACNEREGGCSAGDLYTPRVESDWRSVSVRDEEDLKNTPLDCRQCHQRGRDVGMLLMRELQAPWTHFFEPARTYAEETQLPGVRGSDLVADFLRAKGSETYGGLAADSLRHTVGFVLQNVVPRDQPLLFDSQGIEEERYPWDGKRYASQPGPSPTWQRGYEAFKRGEQLALPYFDARPADPAKLAKLTEAYSSYRAGKLSADELPDLSDIFPDDPMVRAQIGLETEPGATPAEALVQACGSCHNDVLDQTISRASFNIDLSRMSRTELDLAIDRISRARDEAGVMPPPEGRQLSADARTRLLAYLKQDQRSDEDDALLVHAAQVGMTGGGVP